MGDPEGGKHAPGYVDVCIAAAGLVSAFAWLLLDPGADACAGVAAAAITLMEVLRARKQLGSGILEFNLLRTWRFLTPLVAIIMFWALTRELLHTPTFLILDQHQLALLLGLFIACSTMIVLRALSSRFGRRETAAPIVTTSTTVIQIGEINSTAHHYHTPPKEIGRLIIAGLNVIEGAYEVRNFRRRVLRKFDESDLEARGFFPIIELAVENLGEQKSTVERIVLDIHEAHRQHDLGMSIPASWEFTELLDPCRIPEHYEIETRLVSISPNKPARIMFILGHVLGYGHYDSVQYRASVKIRYDEDQTTDSQDCTFTIHCPRDFSPEAPTPVRSLLMPNR